MKLTEIILTDTTRIDLSNITNKDGEDIRIVTAEGNTEVYGIKGITVTIKSNIPGVMSTKIYHIPYEKIQLIKGEL